MGSGPTIDAQSIPRKARWREARAFRRAGPFSRGKRESDVMRNVLVSLAAAATCAAVPAMAVPDIEALPGVIGQTEGGRACYLRVYDAAHLAAHPRQRTTSLRISFERERMPGAALEVGLQNVVRLEAARRGVGSLCTPSGTAVIARTPI